MSEQEQTMYDLQTQTQQFNLELKNRFIRSRPYRTLRRTLGISDTPDYQTAAIRATVVPYSLDGDAEVFLRSIMKSVVSTFLNVYLECVTTQGTRIPDVPHTVIHTETDLMENCRALLSHMNHPSPTLFYLFPLQSSLTSIPKRIEVRTEEPVSYLVYLIQHHFIHQPTLHLLTPPGNVQLSTIDHNIAPTLTVLADSLYNSTEIKYYVRHVYGMRCMCPEQLVFSTL